MAISVSLKTIVEKVAKSLGCMKEGSISVVTNAKTFTIPRFKDYFPSDKGPEDWFLWCNGEWHRVNTWDGNLGVLVTIDDFIAVPLLGDAVQLYRILEPDDWRDAANYALTSLWFEDRITTALSDGKNLYTLSATTWLQTKQQLIRFLWRDVSGGATYIEEPSVAFLRPIEEDNSLSVYIPILPADITNTRLITVAKHYYEALTSEGAMTTCPEPLFLAATKFECLLRIFQKMPTKAKADYGRDLILTERDLAKQKAQYVPEATFEDMREEEPWKMVDMGYIPTLWTW